VATEVAEATMVATAAEAAVAVVEAVDIPAKL
jgi:hypothetical protein